MPFRANRDGLENPPAVEEAFVWTVLPWRNRLSNYLKHDVLGVYENITLRPGIDAAVIETDVKSHSGPRATFTRVKDPRE